MIEYCFKTDDPLLAAKAMELFGSKATVQASAVGARAIPSAAAPPVAASAPPPPVAAAAPPPPPAAPAAPPAAPAAHDAADQAALNAGWTLDLVKSAAAAMSAKQGNEGGKVMQAILQQHDAERLTGGAKPLAPKHYPSVHTALTAAAA